MQNIEPRTLADGAILRAATPADAESIHQFIRDLAEFERDPEAVLTTAQTVAEALGEAGPIVHCQVIDDGGVVVAIALWYRNFSTWTGNGIWLEDLYVEPGHRGRGYASALIASLASIAQTEGWSRIEWWALEWNQHAIDVYTGLGAIPMEELTIFRVDGDTLSALAARPFITTQIHDEPGDTGHNS